MAARPLRANAPYRPGAGPGVPRPPRPTGVVAGPARVTGPPIPDNRIVRPFPNDFLGIVPPNEIQTALYNLTSGLFRSIRVNYNQLPDGFASLIPLIPPDGRYELEFSNGFRVPFNDWNRVSMMHAANEAIGIGSGEEVGSDLDQIAAAISADPVFTIRVPILDERTHYRLWPELFRTAAFGIDPGVRPVPANVRNRPFGAFFPYYHVLGFRYGVNWERYGIYGKDVLDNVPCIYRALKEGGLPEKKLNKLQSILWMKQCPRTKLPEICDILKIRIRLSEIALITSDKKQQRPKHYPSLGSDQTKYAEYALKWPLYRIGIGFDHYFVDDQKTGITKFALENLHLKRDHRRWHPMIKANGRSADGHGIRSTRLFELLQRPEIRDAILRPVTVNPDTMDHIFFSKLGKVYKNLEPVSQDVLPYGDYPIKPGKKKWSKKQQQNDEPYVKHWITYAADFETTTDGDVHRPYLCVCERLPTDEEKDYYIDEYPTNTFKGIRCGEDMIRHCCLGYDKDLHHGIRFLFHNATYDVRFLFPFFKGKPPSVLENCGKIKSFQAQFMVGFQQYVPIMVSDSYAFIPQKLSAFPKMFQLDKELKKEIMPYHLYTEANVFHHWPDPETFDYEWDYSILREVVPWKEFQKAVLDQANETQVKLQYATMTGKQGLGDDDKYAKSDELAEWKRRQVETNIDAWKHWSELSEIKGERYVRHIDYANYYCIQDVQILAKGWLKFRQLCMEALDGLDIDSVRNTGHPYVSINQVSHDYLKEKQAYDGCYWLSGVQRDFLQNCISGGKCMMANNTKQWVEGSISDFDACSLYPTAMAYMGGYLKGKPKIIPNDITQVDPSWDGYFLRLRVLDFGGKKRRFPILSYKNKDGGRVYSDGKDILGKEIYVCKFELEDAIEFYPGFRYEIVQGLYFDQGRNNKISDLMKDLYERRKKFKAEKNPVQQVLKLVMNGSYGRTILKPISDTVHFLKRPQSYQKQADRIKQLEQNENFLRNHFYRIKKYYKMPEDSRWAWRMDVLKDINEHYNAPHIGAEILGYSKTIMNRVMCLAEDMGINIYYQDTDSMHIDTWNIPKLSREFKRKYGRELIGKDMGQFHSDFDLEDMSEGLHDVKKTKPKFDPEQVVSQLFIAVGKKAYLDILIAPTERKDQSRIIGGTPEENGGKRLDDNVEGVHFRLKGVPSQAVLAYCCENDKTLFNVFEGLYLGEEITFDLLAAGKQRFKIEKNFSVRSLRQFLRRVRFAKNSEDESKNSPESIYRAPSNNSLDQANSSTIQLPIGPLPLKRKFDLLT